MLRFDLETLTETIKKSNETDFIVHIHTIGDGAINFALNAMEKAHTKPENRAALTHLQIVKPSDIERMAKLGVVAVSNPYWFLKEDATYAMTASFVGEERAAKQYPMKSFFDKGVVVTQASDYPVTQVPNPLESIQFAVLRQLPGESETLLYSSERVTVEQMIKAATLNGAYQFKCENALGSITVGKKADIVVLDSDITACDPENITGAKVLRTMIGGEWVYTREK